MKDWPTGTPCGLCSEGFREDVEWAKEQIDACFSLKTTQTPPPSHKCLSHTPFQRKRAFLLHLSRHFIFIQWKAASSALGETHPALATSFWKVGLGPPCSPGDIPLWLHCWLLSRTALSPWNFQKPFSKAFDATSSCMYLYRDELTSKVLKCLFWY